MDRFILICIDSVRADFLSCHGGPAQTPTLDRFASEGVRFEQCIAASSLSVPCFGAINTGMAPSTSGLRSHYHEKLPHNVLTLAQRFKNAGYATGCFAYPVGADAVRETNRGFDTYHSIRKEFIQDSGFCPGLSHWPQVKAWLEAHRNQKSFLFLHTMQMHNPYVCGQEIRTAEDKQAREKEIHRPGVMREAYAQALSVYDQRYLSAFFDELRALGLLDTSLIAVCSDHGDGLFDHGESMHGSSLFDTLLRTVMIMRAPGLLPSGLLVGEQFRSVDLAPTVLDLLGVSTGSPSGFRDMDGVSWKAALTAGGTPPEVPAYCELQDLGIYCVRQSHGGKRWKLIRTTPRSCYSHEHAGGVRPAAWSGWTRLRKAARRAAGRNEPFDIALYDLSEDPREQRNLLPFARRRHADVISALSGTFDGYARRAATAETGAGRTLSEDEAAIVNERLKDLGYL